MINNAFLDIFKNFDRFSKSKKISRLQDLENMLARMQGRKPRIIKTEYNEELIGKINPDRGAGALYCRSDPDSLCVLSLDMSSIEAIKNIIHEGFHAYIDDFINGRVPTLRLYSKLDKERFYIEEENLPIISKRFEEKKMLPLFDSYYIEERLNYQEDAMYIVKLMLNSIENANDAMSIFPNLAYGMVYYIDNEQRGKDFEKQYKTTYDEIVIDALNREIDETVKINKNGKILDEIDKDFLVFFNKMVALQKEMSMLLSNSLMMKPAKDKILQEKTQQMTIVYRDYVLKMLRTKKKY